jgi:Protein of unknown function (DUF3987)
MDRPSGELMASCGFARGVLSSLPSQFQEGAEAVIKPELVVDRLREHRCQPQKNGVGYYASCPAHDLKRRELQLFVGPDDGGGVVLKCAEGCHPDDILAAIGLNGSNSAHAESPANHLRSLAEKLSPGSASRATAAGDQEWNQYPLGAPPAKAGEFPITAFPLEIQKLIVGLAETMTASVDLVGGSVLAVAGSAIGQSVNISLSRTWTESPQLYLALVGLTAVKKTPPLKWLVKPLSDIDRDMQEVHKRELKAWTDRDPDARGSKPTCGRIVVQDITTESLAVIHSENPRGLLTYRDELTGWIRSFNQYKGKGADRQFWLSNASGSPLQVDREGGREAFSVGHPLINVCGGLTPDNLGILIRDDLDGRKEHQVDDGFLDRLVFAYPDEFPAQVWTEKELDAESEDLWPEVVRHLWQRTMVHDSGRVRPYLVKFAQEAKAEFVRWHDAHMAEVNPEFPALNELNERLSREKIRGPWSKYHAICARIALVLSRLNDAVNGRDTYTQPDNIDLRSVKGVILLTEYFKRTIKKSLHGLNGYQAILSEDERACISWIVIREQM